MKPIRLIPTISRFAAMAIFAGLSVCAHAATALTISTVFGHNEKDNFGGSILDVYNGSGMNGVEYPNDQSSWPPATDPATWTAGGTSYRDEWQAQAALSEATNSKMGWMVIDLGSVVSLDTLYLWHIRENSARVATDFNIYVATTPTVGVTHGPTTGAADYDFSSGGWTVAYTGLSGSYQGSTSHDLSGYSGRYIGIEIIDNDSTTDVKVGFAEAAVTAIPEPRAALLGGLGLLMLLRRRK